MDVGAQAYYLAGASSNPELQGLRRLQMTTFPVSIFYLDTEPHVEIVRVLHGSRDLPALLDEP